MSYHYLTPGYYWITVALIFWEKHTCRVVRGRERDGYRNLVLLKCFPKDVCGWFSDCSSPRHCQQEAVV